MAFAHLPFISWIKAVLHPHSVLGVPIADVKKFQISALVLMDSIWFARNKLLFDGVQPEPVGLLKESSLPLPITWRPGSS
jgi:hypothetical protein